MKFFIVVSLLPNIGSAQEAGKNEDEYDPVHNVDDAKGNEKTYPEGVAMYTAAAICRKRKHQL